MTLAYYWSEFRCWTLCKMGVHRERRKFNGGNPMLICYDCGKGRYASRAAAPD